MNIEDFGQLTSKEKHKLLLDIVGLKPGDKLTRCFVSGRKRKRTNDYLVTVIPSHFIIREDDNRSRGYYLQEFIVDEDGTEHFVENSTLQCILAIMDDMLVPYGNSKFLRRTSFTSKTYPPHDCWKK